MSTHELAAACAAGGHPCDDDRLPPAAPDAAQRIEAAEGSWLRGDGAISELAKAGGDLHARALLARAYDIAGRPAEAQHTTALVLARAHSGPMIPRDVSEISEVAIRPDGAHVGLMEWRDVYDRAGRLAVKLDTPRCPPGVAAGHR